MTHNNKKKMTVLGVSVALMLSIAGIAIAGGSFEPTQDVKAISNYTISFDSSHNLLSATTTERTDGSIHNESNYSIGITYDDYSLSSGNWGTFAADGYCYNTTKIDGLQSMFLNFSSASTLWVDWGATAGAKTYGKSFTNVTSACCIFAASVPSYFVIEAKSELNIVSGTISFTCKADDGLIEFGSYPQTQVTDSSILSTLNNFAAENPTSSDQKAWTDCGYYENSALSSFMWYKDILLNDGSRYRGLYFEHFRPAYCSDSFATENLDKMVTQQYQNGYKSENTAYWFKYEPLKWQVRSFDGSKYLLMCRSAIDAQPYYHLSVSGNTRSGGIYDNNYKESDIRTWLNGTSKEGNIIESFYDWAFTKAEKGKIETTTVDNSVATTSEENPYVSENTRDKIFLLSYQDACDPVLGFAETWVTDDPGRRIKSTDYAECEGIHRDSSGNYAGCSRWWTRSPSPKSSNYANVVNLDGSFADGNDNKGSFDNVNYTILGIVPFMWVTL